MKKLRDMSKADGVETSVALAESFDALPLDKRLEIFQGLSPLSRCRFLEVLSRPSDLLRHISGEEMFFTIKDMGEESALKLIELTTGSQLSYLLDIELWKNETFHVESAGKWIEIFSAIGDEKLLHFVQISDPELIATLLHRFIKVRVKDPDVDLLEVESFPPFTLDDTYFIEFSLPRFQEPMAHLLDVIFQWDVTYYVALMQDLCFGIALENEESACRWRRSRQAEHGFPDFDEAFDIYRYLSRDSLCDPAQNSDKSTAPETCGQTPFLRYPLVVLNAQSLLKQGLDRIEDDGERNRLATELAHLANKVMIADVLEPGSVRDIHRSLKKVAGHINIALEELCGDDVARAAGFLRLNHLELLFRRGYSIVLDLRKEAQRFLRTYEGGIQNLGYPLAGLMTGLLANRPYYARNYLEKSAPRDFQCLDDLQTIRSIMDTVNSEDAWEDV